MEPHPPPHPGDPLTPSATPTPPPSLSPAESSPITPQTTESTPPPTTADDESAADPPPRKRRRRKKKLFPDEIPSATAARALRPAQHRSSIYDEKLMDELIGPSPSRPRRRTSIAEELDVEALIAIAVGFPVDSLLEEEIEAEVVDATGGADQANYIVVRNHILARWRADVSSWLTEDQAMESIRSEHRLLVSAAYHFLLSHGHINFGLAPAFKEIRWSLSPSTPSANIIIVGAGLAGLAAARHLIAQGFKCIILEGRNRPGGRVQTKKMSGDGVVAAADLGGSVLTGINGNPLGVLARQLGFPLHKVRDNCILYLPSGESVDANVDAGVEYTFNQLLDKVCKLRQAMLDQMKAVDVSLGTALEAFRKVCKVAEKPEEKMLLNWHLANLEYANASLLSDLSLAYWDQDDPYEMGGDHCFIPGGNGRFVHALAEGLPIFYGKTVDCIRYGSDGVMVTANGQVFRGDMVLCTVPLGVLKKGSISFIPELPKEKKEAIRRLGFGVLNKVAMLFPYDFWGGEIDTFGHLTEETDERGEFFLFYSYVSVSGGPLLVALVAGESAIKFESTPPLEAIERVLKILKGIFGPRGIEVPDPIEAVCTRWGKDKFAYGSYSHVAVGASGDDYDTLADSVGDGRVFFAGEATNRRYPATMHGAFLSGLREAANISRAASKRSSVPSTVEGKVNYSAYLESLFMQPDLRFGIFEVMFDPSSINDDTLSLLRVKLNREDLANDSFFLYGLISKKHALALANIVEDDNRIRMLHQAFKVKLLGRQFLGIEGDTLISRILMSRSSRYY